MPTKIKKTGRQLKKFRITKPFTKQQLRVIKRVSTNVGETKYLDTSVSNTSIINTSDAALDSIFTFNMIQGDGQGERLGDRIFAKSLQVRGTLNMTSTNSLRFLIIRLDRYSLDLVSTVNNDFDYTVVGLRGFLPRDVTGYKYKVIMDRVYTLDPDNVNQKYLKFNIPVNKKFEFQNSTTSPYHTNKYRMFIYTDNVTASVISCSLQCRLSYKDN